MTRDACARSCAASWAETVPAGVEELKTRLARWSAGPAEASYVLQMWGYVLDHAALDDSQVPVSAQCDAVPYLPVQPESLGVSLSAGDALLDLGCLGGYGLYDVALRRRRAGLPLPRLVGVDCDATSVAVARDLAETWAAGGTTEFHQASAAQLPLSDASFRMVVGRLLLPYVRVRETLAEIARVTAPGGLTLLQVHAPSYYRQRARERLGRPAVAFYYLRPLLAGLWLGLTGRQPAGRRFQETALSRAGLVRLCRAAGFEPAWQGGFDQKPIFVFRKCKG